MDLWEDRARINSVNNLQKVLDPSDEKGIKNSYIDIYLKYYLQAFLKPNRTDVVLEIGSGIGRLVEYISPLVKEAYGIDLVDKFIDECNTNPSKNKNSHYVKISELNNLYAYSINKAFIVWVLMYLEQDQKMVELLSCYKSKLSTRHHLYVIEQVRQSDLVETYKNNFSASIEL